MAGCRVLEATAVTKILDFLWSPLQIDDCESRRACTKSRIACRQEAEKWRDQPSDQALTLPLAMWEETDWERLDVCDVCLSTMKITHQQAKQSFWDGLLAMFDLPVWTDLEKLKVEALQ